MIKLDNGFNPDENSEIIVCEGQKNFINLIYDT